MNCSCCSEFLFQSKIYFGRYFGDMIISLLPPTSQNNYPAVAYLMRDVTYHSTKHAIQLCAKLQLPLPLKVITNQPTHAIGFRVGDYTLTYVLNMSQVNDYRFIRCSPLKEVKDPKMTLYGGFPHLR